MADYDFYRSSSVSQAAAHPVFFYHIPKCGGMTAHALALHSWTLLLRVAGIDRRAIVARCDTEETLQALKTQQYVFVSSHFPFGTHRLLPGVPRLLTILRSPLGRVVSGYTYNQMRSDRRVAREEFAEVVHQEENVNLITKTLVGKRPEQPSEEGDVEQALFNLDNHFSFVATTEHMKTICESYLRFCGLPNVLSQRINPTLPAYRLDAAEFEDEIMACNSQDAAVFARVRARGPVVPNPEPAGGGNEPFNPLTVVISERGDKERSQTHSRAMQTSQLLESGLLKPDGSSDSAGLDALFEEAPEKA